MGFYPLPIRQTGYFSALALQNDAIRHGFTDKTVGLGARFCDWSFGKLGCIEQWIDVLTRFIAYDIDANQIMHLQEDGVISICSAQK